MKTKTKQNVVNIGFNNFVPSDRIVAVIDSVGQEIKQIINKAKKENKLLEATNGRKAKSVIITDTSHVLLSAVSVMALFNRTK